MQIAGNSELYARIEGDPRGQDFTHVGDLAYGIKKWSV